MLKNFLRKWLLMDYRGRRKPMLTEDEMKIVLHAIRSHMTTIIGFTDILKDDQRMPADLINYLETINKTCWALVAELNRCMENMEWENKPTYHEKTKL